MAAGEIGGIYGLLAVLIYVALPHQHVQLSYSGVPVHCSNPQYWLANSVEISIGVPFDS